MKSPIKKVKLNNFFLNLIDKNFLVLMKLKSETLNKLEIEAEVLNKGISKELLGFEQKFQFFDSPVFTLLICCMLFNSSENKTLY